MINKKSLAEINAKLITKEGKHNGKVEAQGSIKDLLYLISECVVSVLAELPNDTQKDKALDFISDRVDKIREKKGV